MPEQQRAGADNDQNQRHFGPLRHLHGDLHGEQGHAEGQQAVGDPHGRAPGGMGRLPLLPRFLQKQARLPGEEDAEAQHHHVDDAMAQRVEARRQDLGERLDAHMAAPGLHLRR
jgi:hypothetical protein